MLKRNLNRFFKRTALIIITLFSVNSLFAAELTARQVMDAACKKESVTESITYIKTQISKTTVASEKRSMYIFLGGLQEQLSLYEDAVKSYAAAAGISAVNAEGMPKKTNEQLVLDAVRCALCMGDSNIANSYLNSAVRNSKNAEIQLYIKLYTQWSALVDADNSEEIKEPVEILKAYLKVPSMKQIFPQILLTLWYVTGEDTYSNQIKKSYPLSTEASIVTGDIKLLPTPFWFFIPKSGEAEAGSGTFAELPEEPKTEQEEVKQSDLKSSSGNQDVKKQKFSKWQVGFFAKKEYADNLAKELNGKGFTANITSETRASGTTYYIVLVKDDGTGTADKLRSAGYDCYPVE
ncbi:MAG: SPOR domain-containing protein [Treponema sp.]|nr:SPOR domain-containing protein [Treponema sp.]